jgi:predicted nucleic acid-binding protein
VASYFLDTSAYAKRYRREAGSAWVRRICQTEKIFASMLLITELASVIARLAREGAISPTQRVGILRSFQADLENATLIQLERPILERAADILIQFPAGTALRSLDAIHLASAEHAFAAAPLTRSRRARPVLVSADTRLLAAAQWLGLATDNPENHP